MSKTTLEILENEQDRLTKKLEAITLAIKEYKVDEKERISFFKDEIGIYKIAFDSKINIDKPLDGFPIKETWLNQILYLLKNRNRFMSNSELAESLTHYHYDFNIYKMKRKVSVVISAAYKANRIDGLTKIGTTKSAKDALWGFDEWLDGKNKIKEENQPLGTNLNEKITVG